MNWDTAYDNTSTRMTISPYTGSQLYHKQCKDCGQETKSKPTREMQIIGNLHQRIVICECGKPFIDDLNNS
jgi:hypothetical protein